MRVCVCVHREGELCFLYVWRDIYFAFPHRLMFECAPPLNIYIYVWLTFSSRMGFFFPGCLLIDIMDIVFLLHCECNNCVLGIDIAFSWLCW